MELQRTCGLSRAPCSATDLQEPHAALGRVVGGKVVPADQARDRGHIDDRAAAPLEQRQPMLAAEKRAVEIDREDLPPGGEIGLLDVAQRRETRGIDQAVEPVMAAADLGDHAQPVRLRGDVERMVRALPPGKVAGDRNPAFGLDRSATALPIGAGGAGDQNDLVLEPVHAASAVLVVVVWSWSWW